MFAMMILAIHLASRVIVDEPIAPAMGTHFKNLSDVKFFNVGAHAQIREQPAAARELLVADAGTTGRR